MVDKSYMESVFSVKLNVAIYLLYLYPKKFTEKRRKIN